MLDQKIYHIYNRGVEKRDIFEDEADRWRFLQSLYLFNDKESSHRTLHRFREENKKLNIKTLRREISPQDQEPLVKIMADCFMPNHYHLLLEEAKENGISKFMQKLGTGYTNYFNKKHDRVGGLFQGSYKSVRVEEKRYLKYLLVYINVLNPAELIEVNYKEQGIEDIKKVMEFAADYEWSTHKEYLGTRNSFIIDKGILENAFTNPEQYEDFVEMVLNSEKYKKLDHLILEND